MTQHLICWRTIPTFLRDGTLHKTGRTRADLYEYQDLLHPFEEKNIHYYGAHILRTTCNAPHIFFQITKGDGFLGAQRSQWVYLTVGDFVFHYDNPIHGISACITKLSVAGLALHPCRCKEREPIFALPIACYHVFQNYLLPQLLPILIRAFDQLEIPFTPRAQEETFAYGISPPRARWNQESWKRLAALRRTYKTKQVKKDNNEDQQFLFGDTGGKGNGEGGDRAPAWLDI